MDLSADTLLELLDQGLAATPRTYTEQAKARIRQVAVSDGWSASSTSPQTKQLATAMAPYHGLVREQAMQALGRRTVVSVPKPLCNAQAAIVHGTECILLYDGQLDVAVANVAMSYVVQQLPEVFEHTFPRPAHPEVSASGWVSVILGAVINRFLSHGEALPDFRLLMAPPQRQQELRHAFAGAAWWLLLHELGHLELGHLGSGTGPRPPRLANPGSLVVPEALSSFQVEELEADAYAHDSLGDDGRKMFYGWANTALGPAMMLEALAASQGAAHPLSINRLELARQLSEATDTIARDLKSKEHLARHGAARDRIKREHDNIRARGEEPMFSGWSNEQLLAALAGLRGLFEDSGIALQPFLDSRGFCWRSLYDGD